MCINCSPLGPTTKNAIARYGWSVTGVDGDAESVPFAYSSGLTAKGYPELICYGLAPYNTARMINELATRIVAGEQLRHGSRVDGILGCGCDVTLVDVIDKSDMRVTAGLYREFVALQIVWPDNRGRFPWEAGYSVCVHDQPLKGLA